MPGDPATATALEDIVFWYSLLPRAVVAILSGACLGLAGALMQQVLRNPIADPSTLGITAGAQLALALAATGVPLLDALPREAAALAGGGTAAAVVLALGWRSGLEPVTVVLSGMTISLIAAALAATIVLANGEYVLSLFIWGAGSLHQQGWDVASTLSLRLTGGVLAAFLLLLRPLAVLDLSDVQARSLGVALHATRLLAIVVAVWLAASVTAAVGVIGFVGLAAPAFARMRGARTQREILVMSPLLGGLLLWITDDLVQLAAAGGSDLIPTGAATGLLGGPLLLWLLPRLRFQAHPLSSGGPHGSSRLSGPGTALAWLAALIVLLAACVLVIGRNDGGWTIALGTQFSDLLPFRLPRIAAAIAAGALLAAAGMLMQRLTGNPMASPEVLGVSAGAGVGMCAALSVVATPGIGTMLAGSAAGSLGALLAVVAFGAWAGVGAERLLLAGVAIGAACLAMVSAVLALGDPRFFVLLVWMSGSTDRLTSAKSFTMLGAAACLVAFLPLLARWLDILPLGDATSRALGVPLRASRLALLLMAALATALATLVVGPLSLVGLIAPHLARLLGFARGLEQLAAAILLGAGLMLVADWLGRMVIFPYQIPVGLFVSLLGGPYLVWLLQRGEAKRD